MKTKICTKCKIIKPIEEFYKRGDCKYTTYRSACIKCLSDDGRGYYSSHKEQKKEYTVINQEKIKARRQKQWREHGKEIYTKRKPYFKQLIETNLNYKLSLRLRTRLNTAINCNYKAGSAVRDLGCSIVELKQYLESGFYVNPITGEMMSWDNYGKGPGKWQIDHKRPLFSVDLTDREQFLKVVHYTNLQPLWYEDHIQKSAEERR